MPENLDTMERRKPIGEIYEEYSIPPWLQEHMLRVSAVASVICDQLGDKVRKHEVVSACLVHDMGNIIKSKLEMFPDLLKDEADLAHWQSVKKEYIEKYGEDEHVATMEIAKEAGILEETLKLVDRIGLSELSEVMDNGTIENKICIYSDLRIGIFGALSLKDRMDELVDRYKARGRYDEEVFNQHRENLNTIEEELFGAIGFSPEDINDESISPTIEGLRNYKII